MTDFVFVHGGGQGSWVWDETIAALASQSGGTARSVALDAPGCGTKRGRDTSAIAYDDLIAEFVADVEATGLSDIVLVGHSQAGMVLPLMLEKRPGLFSRAVYVSCSAPPPGMTTLERMGNSLQGTNPDEVGWPIDPATSTMEERFRVMFCNDMDDAAADAFLAELGKDMWPACCYSHRAWRYDHLEAVPSTYVLCLQDKALPFAWQEKFADMLRVSGRVRLDAGHQAMNTRPHALAEVLLAESVR